MVWLVLGVLLWSGVHLFKRLAPAVRARMGNAAKAVFALLLVASVVLMVIGYREADGAMYGPAFWGLSPAMVGVNNLLMLVAFYIYAVGGPKGPRVWIGTKLRHPQLIGFSLWAVAHLLVNGDVPSIVLFGGLLVWAQVEILLINAQDGPWTPPPRAGMRQEFTYVLAAVVVVVVVMLIHNWLGVRPWG